MGGHAEADIHDEKEHAGTLEASGPDSSICLLSISDVLDAGYQAVNKVLTLMELTFLDLSGSTVK